MCVQHDGFFVAQLLEGVEADVHLVPHPPHSTTAYVGVFSPAFPQVMNHALLLICASQRPTAPCREFHGRKSPFAGRGTIAACPTTQGLDLYPAISCSSLYAMFPAAGSGKSTCSPLVVQGRERERFRKQLIVQSEVGLNLAITIKSGWRSFKIRAASAIFSRLSRR